MANDTSNKPVLSLGPFNLKQWHIVGIIAIGISLSVFIISIVLFKQLSNFVEFNIRHASILTEDSDLYDKWMDPQYKVTMNLSIFSVRNPDDVMNNSKPILKLTGPYIFDIKLRRKMLGKENGTIKFQTIRSHFFNEEASCLECVLYNRIWIPNMVYQKFVETASKPGMKAVQPALLVQRPFLDVEVAELLFQGYADPFFDQFCTVPFVNFVCETILHLPDRIGFFYGKNDTDAGTFEIKNGEEDGGNSLGEILKWNGANTMPKHWWNSENLLNIHGTDGNLFKPYIQRTDILTVFAPELCRNFKLVYSEELDFNGIHAYKFIVPASEFDFTLEENKIYCNSDSQKFFYPEQKKECLPNGLLDISRCQKGEPPIVISMPNFLYAPDFVKNSIEGLRSPSPKLDQIEVIFEPRLGAILEARRRFQINVAMWKGSDLINLKNFHNSIVPVILVEEFVHIDDGNLNDIKTKLIYVEKVVEFATLSAAIFSIIGIVLIILYIIHKKNGSPVIQYIKKHIKSVNGIDENSEKKVSTKNVQSEC